MPRTYVTSPGDVLDLVVFHAYGGRQAPIVEAVIDANYAARLSEQPPILPAGLTIVLPDIPAEAAKPKLIKLWA